MILLIWSVGHGWGFLLEYTDGQSTTLLKATIKTFSYTREITTQPKILWKNGTSDWSVQLGEEIAGINGVFKASDGTAITVGGVELGDMTSFDSYLADSINE